MFTLSKEIVHSITDGLYFNRTSSDPGVKTHGIKWLPMLVERLGLWASLDG